MGRTAALAALLLASGCSVRVVAVRAAADALSGSGSAFASDDDPELVRDAVPFALKTMEALLAEQPEHPGLLLSLAAGFTQYGYAFVQQEADALDLEGKPGEARSRRERALRLYLRARDYGLRGLEVAHPGLASRLRAVRDLHGATAALRKRDVPLLYWTAASWALAVAAGKEDMGLVAELPAPEALMRRALQLDEGWNEGSIHEFFVSFEAARPGGGPAAAGPHLLRAVQLSDGRRLAPLVAWAEGVLVPLQDREEFNRLLEHVVATDVNQSPRDRLANVIARRRARLLLAHADDLFN